MVYKDLGTVEKKKQRKKTKNKKQLIQMIKRELMA